MLKIKKIVYFCHFKLNVHMQLFYNNVNMKIKCKTSSLPFEGNNLGMQPKMSCYLLVYKMCNIYSVSVLSVWRASSVSLLVCSYKFLHDEEIVVVPAASNAASF